jgi:hypothetical protein
MERSSRDALGGHCLVSWLKVCRPKELGGLSFSDITTLALPLKIRWVWLQKIEPNRQWEDFNIHVPEQIKAFFAALLIGTTTLFWTNRWLHGQSIADLAPRLLAVIPVRKRRKRTCERTLSTTIGFQMYKGFSVWECLLIISSRGTF